MKISNIFNSLLCVVLGFLILSTGEYYPYWLYKVELGVFTYPAGLFFIFLGIYMFVNPLKGNISTKCPSCKATFNSEALKSYMCPKCNVKTIEIEQYFKLYPEEVEDIEKYFEAHPEVLIDNKTSFKTKENTLKHPRSKDLFED